MKRNFVRGALLVAAMGISGTGQAALHDRGSGLIYDDVLDITWLQDANYAKTSGYSTQYVMTWDQAVAWADGLEYFSLFYGKFDDWRLPKIIDTGSPGCDSVEYQGSDCGWNVKTFDASTGTVFSELAYMYYVNLGLKPYYNPDGSERDDFGIFGNGTLSGYADVGLVHNLGSWVYWSSLEYGPDTSYAWGFLQGEGGQFKHNKNYTGHAWAVRDGDVAASVPEPETYALMLAGLGLVGFAARRRRV